MSFFFNLVDTNRERLMNESLRTRPHTPESIRPSTPVPGQQDSLHTTESIVSRKKKHHHHSRFHLSAFREHGQNLQENVVGVFESQKYLDLEAHLTHPDAERLTATALHLLVESCGPLANACADGVQFLVDWYTSVNDIRFASIFSHKKRRTWEEGVQASEGAVEALSQAIQAFREKERLDKFT